MPLKGGLVFDYQKPFNIEMVRPLKYGKQPDILSQHLKWSKQIDLIFEPSQTFHFTIVRSPTNLLASLFNYFRRINPAFHRAGDLENFIDNTWKYM